MWIIAALISLAAGHPPADPPAAPAATRGRALSARRRELALPRTARPGDRNPGAARRLRAGGRADRAIRAGMAEALDGQRRLVREVHHRVKNNLQVVASLLNIHGRTAETAEARAAYAAIGRRVGALVDRPPQPFRRDGGKSRDCASAIAVRACRRAARRRARGGARRWRSTSTSRPSTPPRTWRCRSPSWSPRSSNLRCFDAPEEPVEISLRRTSELTARLTFEQPGAGPGRGGRRRAKAVRADRRRPGQAAALDPRAQARPLQRRFARLSPR